MSAKPGKRYEQAAGSFDRTKEYLPAEEMEKYTDSVGHQPAKS